MSVHHHRQLLPHTNGMPNVARRDAAYRWCVHACWASGSGCVMMPPEMRHRHTGCVAACPAQIDVQPPWAVQALGWSCLADCRCG